MRVWKHREMRLKRNQPPLQNSFDFSSSEDAPARSFGLFLTDVLSFPFTGAKMATLSHSNLLFLHYE